MRHRRPERLRFKRKFNESNFGSLQLSPIKFNIFVIIRRQQTAGRGLRRFNLINFNEEEPESVWGGWSYNNNSFRKVFRMKISSTCAACGGIRKDDSRRRDFTLKVAAKAIVTQKRSERSSSSPRKRFSSAAAKHTRRARKKTRKVFTQHRSRNIVSSNRFRFPTDSKI